MAFLAISRSEALRDRLFRFLNLLDRDIEIIIRPHTDPNREAGIRVC